MHRNVALALLLASLLGIVAGCGSDDEDKGRDRNAPARLALPPLAEQDRGDGKGAAAHSEAPSGDTPVAECSAINLGGKTGAVPFNGFHDISVRGVGCGQAMGLIERTFETWNGKTVAERVAGYGCELLYEDDVNATVRCSRGSDAFRFTFQRKYRKKAYKIDTRECGTFNRYYDITSVDVVCQSAATVLAGGASRWGSLPSGRPQVVLGYRCSVIYTEGRHKTIRCTASGRRALRFSVATKPSAAHPRQPPKDEAAAVRIIPQQQTTTGRGLSTNVVTVCPPNGPWQAITAKGVSCDSVDRLLASGGKGLTGLARGRTARVSTFMCKRIDTAGQAPTVRCIAPGGVTFRGSMIGASPAAGTTSNSTQGTPTASTPAVTSRGAPADGSNSAP